MSISSPFIHRPVATTLLTAAVAFAGALAYAFLPVSPLPQVEFPTIQVSAALPGASPETMASSVATPLERQFGRISGITEMTSSSNLGSTSVVLQFDLSRDIDAAAREVQAAINAARSQLPANLPNNPTYRKVNPADAPILILSLTSDIYDRGRIYDAASSILQQKLSQIEGVGQVTVGGGALPAVRVQVNPTLLNAMSLGLEDVRSALTAANVNRPKGEVRDRDRTWEIGTTDQLVNASEYEPIVIAFRNGAPVPLSQVATVRQSVEDIRTLGLVNGKPAIPIIIFREPGANIIETVDRTRSNDNYSRIGSRRGNCVGFCSHSRCDGCLPVSEKPPHHTHTERGRAGFAHWYVQRDVSRGLQPGQSVVDGVGDCNWICRR
jgi:multidrug efflux pump